MAGDEVAQIRQLLRELSPRERLALQAILKERRDTGSSDTMVSLMADLYEELPVPMEEFLISPQFLDLGGVLYPKIRDLLIACDDPDIREFSLELGKGSGKSLTCSATMIRQVYRFMCFRNPHRYLELDPASSLAVVNMSVQAGQAERIVFAEFKARVARCPWFNAPRRRYRAGNRILHFEKNLIAVAGNSSDTAFLGYHTVCGVLDEVNYFKDRASGESAAEDVVTALRGSLQTRAPHDYKLGMISSVRTVDDFLSRQVARIQEAGWEVPWERLGRETHAAILGGA